MFKISNSINSVKFQNKQKKSNNPFFGNNYVQSCAPMPVYTQVPYGINKANYIKLGVDMLPNGLELHSYRLSNGQDVQIIKKEGATSVLTRVNVGAFDEKGYPKGIAHFIEHSVYHGAQSHEFDLAQELDKITTYSNASTTSRETKYYMDLSSDSIEALNCALDIQSDMLLRPTFSGIEKEKPIVKSEYQKYMLDDTELMYDNLLKILFRYSDTNEASISGNNETIDSITKDDMNRFHSNFYKPSNMITLITSKYNPDEIIGLVASNFVSKSPKDFSPIERRPVALIDRTTRTDIVTNNSSDGNVFVSFAIPNLSNSFEKLKLDALCSIFLKRYIDFPISNMQSSSIGLVSIPVRLDDEIKPNEAIQELYQKIIDLKTKPPSEKELKEVKEDLLKELDKSFDSGNIAIMENILNVMQDGKNYIPYQTYRQMIEGLSVENVFEMTQYFDLNKAAIVVSHPKNSTKTEILQQDSQNPYYLMPLDIAANCQKYIYPFYECFNQSTGDKFYQTTLQDGSRVCFVNSRGDNCEVDWRLDCEESYSCNPASKFILSNLFPYIFSANASYSSQDIISPFCSAELKEIDDAIIKMKSFSHFDLTQKQFEDAKKEALKMVEDMDNSVFEQYFESLFGSKYSTNKDFLKQQIEKLTINEVVADLNNMILNSKSSYVVKAPIFDNPTLMQNISNLLNSSNMNFRPQAQNSKLTVSSSMADCVLSVDNANQNQIAQGYNFDISDNPKDYYIFNLLSKILAQKNHNTIREKLGLAYYSGASFKQKGTKGAMMLTTEASCNNKGELEQIYSQYGKNIDELLSGQISEDELLLAKNKLKGYLKSCFNDKDEAIVELLQNFAFRPYILNSLSTSDDIIDSITVEDINRAALYVFKNKAQNIIIAKQSMLDRNMEYINTFGKVEKR